MALNCIKRNNFLKTGFRAKTPSTQLRNAGRRKIFPVQSKLNQLVSVLTNLVKTLPEIADRKLVPVVSCVLRASVFDWSGANLCALVSKGEGMSMFSAVPALRDNELLAFALLLICVSLMVYLSKHWVRVSVRDRDAAKQKKFCGLLAWNSRERDPDPKPVIRRKRPDNAFEGFLRS